jgi:hypothetical protein
MANRWIIQSRSGVSILLVGFWVLGVCGVAATTWFVQEHELRHPAILLSAYLVVALIVLGWALMLMQPGFDRIARLAWTLGALMLLIHIVVAFWLAHGWSHAAAVEHVREVGGFGSGIIVNYLFVLIWSGDIVWWWISPVSRSRRPRWVGWVVHGFLLFVVLNATVIFGSPEQRPYYGILFFLLLLPSLRRSSS